MSFLASIGPRVVRRTGLLLLLSLSVIPLVAVGSAADCRAANDARPNFVIIMADDLGYADIGCFGSKRIRTPHLDRMAAEGMRMVDFHSSGAVCSPTRAGLMTGRYQQRAGIPAVIVADPTRPTHPHGIQDQEITFAELLTDAGYKTAIFGKWHLGYYRKYNPVRHGFGEFRGYISGNVDFFSHIDQAGRLDWWRDDKIEDEPGYTTHLITRHAVEFIEANSQSPFCLYLPYEPPHYPYQGPNDAAIRTVGKARGKRETQQSPSDIRRAYKEMVEAMDAGIGEVLAALEKKEVADHTLVMFFSDNGATNRGETGPLRGNKGQLWEGGHRVPFIAKWPTRIAPGGVSSETAISLDVMPTLLAAAGVSTGARKLDGVDLMPLLSQGRSLPPRKLFWGAAASRAMRDGPWKAITQARGQKGPALFRLDKDLSEKNDLSKQYPDRLATMLQEIEAWERDVAKDAPVQPTQPPK